MKNSLPREIFSGLRGKQHVQGIALDRQRESMYFSFTTELVRTDLSGRVIGSVRGLTGHLGCIALGPDGKIYGSLEYKNDAIGKGISRAITGRETLLATEGFYIAIFDGEKIVREGMDAEKDDVMRAAFLPTVTDDYLSEVASPSGMLAHRYGCSGIDGVTFAPAPGDPASAPELYVAYGIYADAARTDNDYQVLLRYCPESLLSHAQPLSQSRMHTSGPAAPSARYFVYTGNTNWGVQNLEYDAQRGGIWMAVYRGIKPEFPNYPMYLTDLTRPAVHIALSGSYSGESGDVLSLVPAGLHDSATGVSGWAFPYGSTGMIALGNDEFYFSHEARNDEGVQSTRVHLYRYTGNAPSPFDLI